MRQLKIQYQITIREGISLEKYLNEISKLSPLSPEREVVLAKKIRAGDEPALVELVNCNLRFVVSVAKQYQNQGLSLNDLINEGNLGLLKAAKRFDETKGFKFISYAVWWIRQSIMQALLEHSRLIRLPLNKVDSYQKINKALTDFLQVNQRKPTTAELAELTGLTPSQVKNILRISNRHVSMDAPIGDDENTSMSNLLESDKDQSPEELAMKGSLRQEIEALLQKLNERERNVLLSYFGINEKPPQSLEEIGLKYGLTRERVRQIKERAIRRLRKSSVSKDLRMYLS